MSKFYMVTEKTVEATALLTSKNFTELQEAIFDPEVAEPLKLIINKEERLFWVTDSLGLQDTKQIIKEKKQEIKNINLNQLKSWEN